MRLPKIPKTEGVRFRHVKEFPGYAVGDDGTIWSSKGGVWKALKRSIHARAGLRVNFTRDGKHFQRTVSNIVWDAFSRRCRGDLNIHYKDGNRTNCRLGNLELNKDRFYSREFPRSKYPVRYILECKAKGMTLANIARRIHAEPNIIGNVLYGPTYARHREVVMRGGQNV